MADLPGNDTYSTPSSFKGLGAKMSALGLGYQQPRFDPLAAAKSMTNLTGKPVERFDINQQTGRPSPFPYKMPSYYNLYPDDNGSQITKPFTTATGFQYPGANPDTTMFKSFPSSTGIKGEYAVDSSNPGRLLRSGRDISTYEKKMLLAGRPSSLFEVDHAIPLWAGGVDTPANRVVLDRPTHDKKTRIEDIAYAAMTARDERFRIPQGRAQQIALRWQEIDDSDLPDMNERGFYNEADAKAVIDRWEAQAREPVKPFDWKHPIKSWKNFVKAIPDGTKAVAEGIADNRFFNENKNRALGEFVKGAASGLSAGWVPYTPYEGSTMFEKAMGVGGVIAGSFMPATLAAKVILRGGSTLGSALRISDTAKKLGIGMQPVRNYLNVDMLIPQFGGRKEAAQLAYQRIVHGTVIPGLGFAAYGQASPEGLMGVALQQEQAAAGERLMMDLLYGLGAPMAGTLSRSAFGTGRAALQKATGRPLLEGQATKLLGGGPALTKEGVKAKSVLGEAIAPFSQQRTNLGGLAWDSTMVGLAAASIGAMADDAPADILTNAILMSVLHGVGMKAAGRNVEAAKQALKASVMTNAKTMGDNIMHQYLPDDFPYRDASGKVIAGPEQMTLPVKEAQAKAYAVLYDLHNRKVISEETLRLEKKNVDVALKVRELETLAQFPQETAEEIMKGEYLSLARTVQRLSERDNPNTLIPDEVIHAFKDVDALGLNKNSFIKFDPPERVGEVPQNSIRIAGVPYQKNIQAYFDALDEGRASPTIVNVLYPQYETVAKSLNQRITQKDIDNGIYSPSKNPGKAIKVFGMIWDKESGKRTIMPLGFWPREFHIKERENGGGINSFNSAMERTNQGAKLKAAGKFDRFKENPALNKDFMFDQINKTGARIFFGNLDRLRTNRKAMASEEPYIRQTWNENNIKQSVDTSRKYDLTRKGGSDKVPDLVRDVNRATNPAKQQEYTKQLAESEQRPLDEILGSFEGDEAVAGQEALVLFRHAPAEASATLRMTANMREALESATPEEMAVKLDSLFGMKMTPEEVAHMHSVAKDMTPRDFVELFRTKSQDPFKKAFFDETIKPFLESNLFVNEFPFGRAFPDMKILGGGIKNVEVPTVVTPDVPTVARTPEPVSADAPMVETPTAAPVQPDVPVQPDLPPAQPEVPPVQSNVIKSADVPAPQPKAAAEVTAVADDTDTLVREILDADDLGESFEGGTKGVLEALAEQKAKSGKMTTEEVFNTLDDWSGGAGSGKNGLLPYVETRGPYIEEIELPSHMNSGIRAKIYQGIERDMKDAGFKNVYVNAKKADVAFWTSLGFKPKGDGEVKGSKILMSKEVDEHVAPSTLTVDTPAEQAALPLETPVAKEPEAPSMPIESEQATIAPISATPDEVLPGLADTVLKKKRPDWRKFLAKEKNVEGPSQGVMHLSDDRVKLRDFTRAKMTELAKEVSDNGRDVAGGWPKFLDGITNRIRTLTGNDKYEITSRRELNDMRWVYNRLARVHQRMEMVSKRMPDNTNKYFMQPGPKENLGQADLMTERFNEANGLPSGAMKVVSVGEDFSFEGLKSLDSRKKFDLVDEEMWKNHILPVGITAKGVKNVVGVEFNPALVERFNKNPSKYMNEGEKTGVLFGDTSKFLRAYAVDVLGLPKNVSAGDFVKRANILFHRYDQYAGPDANQKVKVHIAKARKIGEDKSLALTEDKFDVTNKEAVKSTIDKFGEGAQIDGKLIIGENLHDHLVRGFSYEPGTHMTGLKPLLSGNIEGPRGGIEKLLHKGHAIRGDAAIRQMLKDEYGIDLKPDEIVSFDTNAKIGPKEGTYDIRLGDIYAKSMATGNEARSTASLERKFLSEDVGVAEDMVSRTRETQKDYNQLIKDMKKSKSAEELSEVATRYADKYNLNKESLFHGVFAESHGLGAAKINLGHNLEKLTKNTFFNSLFESSMPESSYVFSSPAFKMKLDGPDKPARYPKDDEVILGREFMAKNNINPGDEVMVLRHPSTDINNIVIAKALDGSKVGHDSLGTEHGVVSIFNERIKLQGDQDGDKMMVAKIGAGGVPQSYANAIKRRGSKALPFTEVKPIEGGTGFISTANIREVIKNQLVGDDQSSSISTATRIMDTVADNGIKVKVHKGEPMAGSKYEIFLGDKLIHEGTTATSQSEFTAIPKWGPEQRQLRIQALQEALDSKKSKDIIKRTEDNDRSWMLKQVFELDGGGDLTPFQARSLNDAMRHFHTPFNLKGKLESFRNVNELMASMGHTINIYKNIERAGGKLTPFQKKIIELEKTEQFSMPDEVKRAADKLGTTAVRESFPNINTKNAALDALRVKAFNAKERYYQPGQDRVTKAAIRKEVVDFYNERLDSGQYTQEDLDAIAYWAASSDQANFGHNPKYATPKWIFRFNEMINESPSIGRVYYTASENMDMPL